jgi:hypothetical protein
MEVWIWLSTTRIWPSAPWTMSLVDVEANSLGAGEPAWRPHGGKSSRNNGGKGPNTRSLVCSRDGRQRQEEGEKGCNLLCSQYITVGSRHKPTVITLHHFRVKPKTDSDMLPMSYCRFLHEPAVIADITAGLSLPSIIGWVELPITAGSGFQPAVKRHRCRLSEFRQ